MGERHERADESRGKGAPVSGFPPEQLVATALDRRTKILYRIEGYEYLAGCRISVAKQASQAGAT